MGRGQWQEQESEADLLGSLQDGVLLVDPAGMVTVMNPAAEDLFGVSVTSARGRPLQCLAGANSVLVSLVDRALATGRAHGEHEVALAGPGGRVWVSAIASLLSGRDGTPRGGVLVLRDLTRIRELEEQVRRSERLAALGTLVAGLAHEIRNPLMGLRGAAQLLQAESGLPPDLKEYTSVIIREVDRLNTLVEGMLSFARPRQPRISACNVNQLIEETLLVEEARIDHRGICVRRIYDPQVPAVAADPDQLRQVLLNLIRNGFEAMPHGGELVVRTSYERRSPRCFGLSVAVLEIVDQGLGLSPEAEANLFNPFFTTKSSGSGLGLSICQRIVSEHRGLLTIAGDPGGGCRATVLLPLARQ